MQDLFQRALTLERMIAGCSDPGTRELLQRELAGTVLRLRESGDQLTVEQMRAHVIARFGEEIAPAPGWGVVVSELGARSLDRISMKAACEMVFRRCAQRLRKAGSLNFTLIAVFPDSIEARDLQSVFEQCGRDVARTLLGAYLRHRRCVRYFTAMEGWAGDGVVAPPREDPNRREALAVQGHNATESYSITSIFDRRGGRITLRAPIAHATNPAECAWSGLLTDDGMRTGPHGS